MNGSHWHWRRICFPGKWHQPCLDECWSLSWKLTRKMRWSQRWLSTNHITESRKTTIYTLITSRYSGQRHSIVTVCKMNTYWKGFWINLPWVHLPQIEFTLGIAKWTLHKHVRHLTSVKFLQQSGLLINTSYLSYKLTSKQKHNNNRFKWNNKTTCGSTTSPHPRAISIDNTVVMNIEKWQKWASYAFRLGISTCLRPFLLL